MPTIAAARRSLAAALAHPGRKQLAHVAILDVAMATTQQLEAQGVAAADAARASEEISAYLAGEADDFAADLPEREMVVAVLGAALETIAANPAFARLFAAPPP